LVLTFSCQLFYGLCKPLVGWQNQPTQGYFNLQL
jgi:hypothetical protein